jgi:2-polyprenyl-6-hydroxyphenyl methylase / 3-demethylubiquinone-9 3-methyltransferase
MLPYISFKICLISQEHLHDLNQAVLEIKRVLKPGGVFVFDTINRTWWSWVMTVLLPQHILAILPRDVHDWRMFIMPKEMKQLLENHGFEVPEITEEFRGMTQVFNPLTMLRKLSLAGGVSFSETRDLSASFLGWARKPE